MSVASRIIKKINESKFELLPEVSKYSGSDFSGYMLEYSYPSDSSYISDDSKDHYNYTSKIIVRADSVEDAKKKLKSSEKILKEIHSRKVFSKLDDDYYDVAPEHIEVNRYFIKEIPSIYEFQKMYPGSNTRIIL